MRAGAWRVAAVCLLVAGPAPGGGAAAAEPRVWRLAFDAAASEVSFELGATLHTVRGRFTLREGGEVRFVPESGVVTGQVVVDARSGETGNASRDRNMHADVLESERYPEIVLVPERIEVSRADADAIAGVLHGRIRIHGGEHPVAIALEARRTRPGLARVDGSFEVPFVAWGLPDPSSFLLRVDPTLSVRFEAVARLVPEPGSPRP